MRILGQRKALQLGVLRAATGEPAQVEIEFSRSHCTEMRRPFRCELLLQAPEGTAGSRTGAGTSQCEVRMIWLLPTLKAELAKWTVDDSSKLRQVARGMDAGPDHTR